MFGGWGQNNVLGGNLTLQILFYFSAMLSARSLHFGLFFGPVKWSKKLSHLGTCCYMVVQAFVWDCGFLEEEL